ncbi:UbiD family decarboxylase [Colletotrichum orchidophilum]|uniref:UbiD family decarboxylase n=1 Tax=Colletotrichum orchidophilum TaxID=1209926 RepID=A0A1G4BFZ2_9PEZI|nr:UbiD family decarboxylase [Colletotrichum orchidophilum]OHF00237.1 UbiD family decarboxylase [Colletotrichum orchidophilum]
MVLTVLTDDQIKTILADLTADEFDGFRKVISTALHEYSTNTHNIEDGTYHQPERVSTENLKTGATTLYMPSVGPQGMGCKGDSHILSSSPRTSILTPRVVVTLSSSKAAQDPLRPSIQPTGAVTLLSPDGQPVGFLHAKTLTAFRTALSSTCLLARRSQVKTITVFGTGLQAYWHVRLALLVRGATIKQVNVINRRFSDGARGFMKQFYGVPAHIKEREGWAETTFSILTPGYGEFKRLQREQIRDADVVYCCTPSTEELFEAEVLTSHEGRRKGRLIAAIGSYRPEMRELPEGLLLQATKHEKPHWHFHKHAPEGGVIVVDTLDGALKEAGEIIAAGLQPTQLVELGELIMLRRMHEEEGAASADDDTASIAASELEKLDFSGSPSIKSAFSGSDGASVSESRSSISKDSSTTGSSSSSKGPSMLRRSSSQRSSDKRKKEDALVRWLKDGTVIYKSVGLGLMDLSVGMHMIQLAKEKGIGTLIEGF